jgi:hypothetical protein
MMHQTIYQNESQVWLFQEWEFTCVKKEKENLPWWRVTTVKDNQMLINPNRASLFVFSFLFQKVQTMYNYRTSIGLKFLATCMQCQETLLQPCLMYFDNKEQKTKLCVENYH